MDQIITELSFSVLLKAPLIFPNNIIREFLRQIKEVEL